MSSPIQLTKIEELIGKTITQVYIDDDETFLKFSDDSFACFEIETTSVGFTYDRNKIILSDDEPWCSNQVWVKLGYRSSEEHYLIVREEERKDEELYKSQELRWKEQIELSERDTLLKLQEKYAKG
jgi:hypothetical protein